MRFVKICFILLLALSLGACSYSLSEVDQKVFLVALGIDKGDKNGLQVTFLFANPNKSGGGEEGGKGGTDSGEVVVVNAPSIHSAMRQIDSFKSKEIDISHTKLIVFSSELAKEGIQTYIGNLTNANDLRPNVTLCVSRGKASEYLKSVNPVHEMFVEKYFDLIMNKLSKQKKSDVHLHKVYSNLLRGEDSVLPLVGTNPAEEEAPPLQAEDDFSDQSIAGHLTHVSENTAEVAGLAAFSGDTMVAELGVFDTILVHLLNENLAPTFFSAQDPRSAQGRMVTVQLQQEEAVHLSVERKGEKLRITAEVPLGLAYISISESYQTKEDYEVFEEDFAQRLHEGAQALVEKMQTEWECDVFHLGRAARRTVLTQQAWEEYRWPQLFQNAEVDIRFKVCGNHFGEMIRVPSKSDS